MYIYIYIFFCACLDLGPSFLSPPAVTMARKAYVNDWCERLVVAIGHQQELLCLDPDDDSSDDASDSSDEEDELDELMVEIHLSFQCQYINRPEKYHMSTTDIFATLESFSDKEWRSILRMTRKSFISLVGKIFDDPIFKNESYREQEQVVVQLSLTLDRLGHNGNGMTSIRQRRFWGRSEGSFYNYGRRVREAILNLRQKYLYWPTEEERQQHCLVMGLKGFHGCVGFIDGTTIPILQRPGHLGDFYYDRHGEYSFNLQVVCNTDRKIIYAYTGHSGKNQGCALLRMKDQCVIIIANLLHLRSMP